MKATQRPRSGPTTKAPTTKAPTTRAPKAPAAKAPVAKTSTATTPKKDSPATGHRTITIAVPPLAQAADLVVEVASLPMNTARRLLPAKGGLPLYAGLGALAVLGALEWPVAMGVGIGYAVLRHRGPLAPPTEKR
ncbi:hypothetical protein CP978_03965 [Streptomyces nodosus]|uniref:Uncharacterized protein n=2 Tax=Streptomyces nodosus TaxID=40318 RepID=A0A0B5D7F3_9ACTN|nr:hypothetical protein SNOD_03575 [Streptomyces nodosus]QEV43072.1 hypothetical protein CP978_03965 [Streptomyces nodosus]